MMWILGAGLQSSAGMADAAKPVFELPENFLFGFITFFFFFEIESHYVALS